MHMERHGCRRVGEAQGRAAGGEERVEGSHLHGRRRLPRAHHVCVITPAATTPNDIRSACLNQKVKTVTDEHLGHFQEKTGY